MIYIKKFAFNPLQVNCFVLYDETKEAVIIDPACFNANEREQLEQFVESEGLKPTKILLTHGHFDHIMGCEYVKAKFKIPVVVHKQDEPLIQNAVAHADMFGLPIEPIEQADEYMDDNETVTFGDSKLKVLHLPGHSPGGVGIICEEQKFGMVGDVLFHGSIGRTDLPMGDHATLISSIKDKLIANYPDIKIFSGHGPETSTAFEADNNPFLQ
ncbi:MBL fold metallo-hydrolase [Prolixibacteraceae bacterium JC049]|nr:MBL fold metallo-hydrolase [Prolixibacteraceae bacterium JC049]